MFDGSRAAAAPNHRMGAEHGSESEFPAGLRVLVVDDDRICLLILDRLLRECLYRVTTCERAVDALKLLRDNRDGFDVVISDVHMPDMDGYKLLELVGLEMDLPVLMMSSNSETSAVMKGIKHGACDYLLKPVRIEELKNIWQHVFRRKQKEQEQEGDERHKPDDGADFLAIDSADGASKASKKRKDNLDEEDDFEPENEDPATSKKPRVVWSVDLHQKFVNAVDTLGIDKAVPKRILELMDVKGLTRENVASHLQKYRLYLKRLSGVPYQGCAGVGSTFFGGTDERFWPTGAGLMGDYRSQLQPHSLISSLHSGLFERVVPNSMDPVLLGQLATIQGISTGAKPPFAIPLLNSANDLNHPVSSGIDVKVMGRGIGGQGPNDQLYNSPLTAHTERFFGQSERSMLTDHQKNKILAHLLQQQRIDAQMALPDVEMSNMQRVETCSSLINDSLNSLNSSCKPNLEMASIGNQSYEPSFMLGPFRKKSMELKSHNNVFDSGLGRFDSLSSLVPQSVTNAVELCSKDKLAGSQFDQVGGNNPFRLRTGLLTSCKGWNQDHNLGNQANASLGPTIHNQGSNLSQASKLSCGQEPTMGWIPSFNCESAEEAIDVKPLATGVMPALEQDFGAREVLIKAASLESLLASKMGTINPESFSSSAEDLLTTYIKQQQHGIESATEDNTEDDYTLGNMYVK